MWYIVEVITCIDGIDCTIVAARSNMEDAHKLANAINAEKTSKSDEFEVWSEDAWLTHETIWLAKIIKNHQ